MSYWNKNKPQTNDDQKLDRPKNISEAKKLISSVFRRNHWDKSEQAEYFRQIGVSGAETSEDVRKIIFDMASAKMLLFKDGELK